MELGGALERLREFQLAEVASDVAQGRVGRKRLSVEVGNDSESDGVSRERRRVELRRNRDDGTIGGRSWLNPLGIEQGAIFGR